MIAQIKDFLKEEDGLAAVEYSVLAAVVIAGVIALAPVIYDTNNNGNNTNGVLNLAISKLKDARNTLNNYL